MILRSGRIKILSLGISLSACAGLPPFPEVNQCGVNGSPRAFYCEDTTTHKQKKLPIDSPLMKGAQCLSADDYKKSEAWVTTVQEIASQHCH